MEEILAGVERQKTDISMNKEGVTKKGPGGIESQQAVLRRGNIVAHKKRRCSVSLVIREVQKRAAMRNHFPPQIVSKSESGPVKGYKGRGAV